MATDEKRRWINSQTDARPTGWAKPRLTPQQRQDIRQRVTDGEDLQALALEYGVTTSTIRHYAP
jgi:DNA-binding NarL/FixJ family response regulator